MMSLFEYYLTLALAVVLFLGEVNAAPASSTFILSGADSNVNLTFAVNVPQGADLDDLFFYLSGPASISWLAVGVGAQMRGSLMFIAYPGTDGNKAILSPRIANGNSEPTYTSDIKVDVLDGSGVINGVLTIKAHCRNCRKWKGGSLDVNSQNQAWIYAVGRVDNSKTDSLTVGLRRHDGYGRFNMDMRQATGEAGVPTNITQNSGATQNGPRVRDRDLSKIFHALLMCATFVILFPVGAIFMRIFGSVRMHRLTQIFSVMVILIGLGLGIKLSKQYNKSKKFHSAHQIIGLLVISLCISQATLGLIQHHMYQKSQRKTLLNLIHRIAGPFIILLGILNGGIGFTFANSPRRLIPYVIIIVAIALFFTGLIFITTKWSQRKAAIYDNDNPRTTANLHEDNSQSIPQQQQQNNIPLSNISAPLYAGYPPPHIDGGQNNNNMRV